MEAVYAQLGYKFKNEQLLALALTHSSAVVAQQAEPMDYQRLEFLGDAVLDLFISERLYKKHPCADEGQLHAMRAAIVCGQHLAFVAETMGCAQWIAVGTKEQQLGASARENLLSDVMEALIGAVYLDAGYERTVEVFEPYFQEALNASVPESGSLNPKGVLQETLQSNSELTPEYVLLDEQGPVHSPLFTVEVYWKGVLLGSGKGNRKKLAEAAAAQDALERKRWKHL